MSVEETYKIEIEKFGKKLRAIRTSLNLSQLDMELRSGINRTEISRIENGKKNIEFFTMTKLAHALGVEIRELFSE
jgi:HTH-type transcriptional regulator, competence development regulator